MRLGFVFGTRPEVIKLAPVILAARRAGIQSIVALTGQHRDLALPLLRLFGIEADYELDVMRRAQTLSSLSARLLRQLDNEFLKGLQGMKPGGLDALVVQGDTTSAFVAAYWGYCHRIPVAHVEAGLRTEDLFAPYPEEGNRQLIGRLAKIHFAPTVQAKRALISENVRGSSVEVVGNTSIDALKLILKKLESNQVPAKDRLSKSIRTFVRSGKIVLVTAHRRESFGKPFVEVCKGIRKVAESGQDIRVVYPVHPNPNVRNVVQDHLSGHPRIMLCDPLPYAAFAELMAISSVLLTDSGGVQEEGPTLRKPIVVMRNKTERPEGVSAGYAVLSGTDSDRIARSTLKALREGCAGRGKNPYGDGKAATRIVKTIQRVLG